MITVIYGTRNGTQDSIAWWLCNEELVGPQIYKAPFYENPWEGKPHGDSGLVNDWYRHDEHTECHRLMENIKGDIIAPMRKFEDDYKMLVWSNYFGCLGHTRQKIDCDKLIVCEQSIYEDAFHYMITHAFKGLDHEEITSDSELWWTDHKLVNGEVTDAWKDIWYKNYEQKMHDALDNGKLKYMWQLNFMHWDLHHAIENNLNHEKIELSDPENLKRLLVKKLIDPEEKTQTDIVVTSNPGCMYVKDPTWWDAAVPYDILDYLDMGMSDQLQKALTDYIEAYKERKEWFDELVVKTFE